MQLKTGVTSVVVSNPFATWDFCKNIFIAEAIYLPYSISDP